MAEPVTKRANDGDVPTPLRFEGFNVLEMPISARNPRPRGDLEPYLEDMGRAALKYLKLGEDCVDDTLVRLRMTQFKSLELYECHLLSHKFVEHSEQKRVEIAALVQARINANRQKAAEKEAKEAKEQKKVNSLTSLQQEIERLSKENERLHKENERLRALSNQ